MSINYRIRFKKGEFEFEVEGDKEFVEEKYEGFKTEIRDAPITKTENNLEQQNENPIFKHSFHKIYKNLSLKTNLDRILFFGYWKSKVENTKEFTVDDLLEYFTKLSLSKPSSPKRDFRDLINKKGYFIPGSNENLYSISYDGMNYIDDKLNELEIK